MTEQTTGQVEGINLNDLALVINVIDVCTKRGAFEGPEIQAVGTLRNKIEAFVKANVPDQGAASQPSIETPTEDSEVTTDIAEE